MRDGALYTRTKAFALAVIRFVGSLPSNRMADVLGKQLLRSGTSVGANYRAACRARSTADFINKLGMVEEEADESLFWLELFDESGLVQPRHTQALSREANEITAMVVASIRRMKGAPFRTPNSELRTRRSAGQALVELAILGAMILLVLGVLVDYGLRADFTQHAMMATFRQVLKDAAVQTKSGEPISTSRLSLADRRIPDPANPFALGATAAISASAGGVTQNYQMHKTPDATADMPRFYVGVREKDDQGRITTEGVNCREDKNKGCLTSDIRYGGAAASLPRYQVVYGASNVCVVSERTCPDGPGELFIQDPCMGEIVDVDMCRRVGRLMTDSAACVQECGLEGRTDCGTVCSQATDRPWYTTATEQQWAALEYLGVQPGSARRSVLKGLDTGAASIHKLESDARIGTQTAFKSEETTTRTFAYRGAGANPAPEKTVTSTSAVGGAVSWETAW